MLGVSGQPVDFGGLLFPLEAHGVKVVSVGLSADEEQPVVWRGPMLHEIVRQFLGDVAGVIENMPAAARQPVAAQRRVEPLVE